MQNWQNIWNCQQKALTIEPNNSYPMQLRNLMRVVTPTLIIGLLVIAFVGIPPTQANPGEETTYYLLTDHLGSVDVVLDEQGEVVERRDYLPYGSERLSDSAPDATETDHKFTGKKLDDETGLYYYGARYYDPLISRFLAFDPWQGNLSDPQSLNKYAYVLNNPIKFIDPTGMYNMKSGEVEKGDTLGGITSELNDYFGTRHSYQDIAKINNISDPNKLQIGQLVRMGTINADGSTWTRAYDSDKVTIGYWTGLTTDQKRVTHYGRNLFQPSEQLPWSESVAKILDWDCMGEALAHNMNGAEENIDYRGTGVYEGMQAVYNSNGQLVTNEENKGTYDFGTPLTEDHFRMDIEPWVKWGNSPQDTTAYGERSPAVHYEALEMWYGEQ